MLAHPNVTTGISYHTYGDLILYPYGYTYEDLAAGHAPRRPPDVRGDGRRDAGTAGYHAQQSSDLYITDGDWNDWMYGALHRYPITIEMSGGGFYPPDEFIPGEARRNWQAALFVARHRGLPDEDRRRPVLVAPA